MRKSRFKEALVKLEEARQEKRIGKGLEPELEVLVTGNLHKLLSSYAPALKEILNVSKVTVVEDLSNSVIVQPATGHKCARCWNFMPEVSSYGIWQNVCTRCQSALREMNIAPPQSQD